LKETYLVSPCKPQPAKAIPEPGKPPERNLFLDLAARSGLEIRKFKSLVQFYGVAVQLLPDRKASPKDPNALEKLGLRCEMMVL
jgi:hypothetical protein